MLNFAGKDNFVWWTGVVEDVNDPEKLGRVRIRIIGYHEEFVQTEELPWASPIMPMNSASAGGIGISPTGVIEGSWCLGFFRDGEYAQDPIIWGTVPGKQVSPDGNRSGRGSQVPGALKVLSGASSPDSVSEGTAGYAQGDTTATPEQLSNAGSAELTDFLKQQEGFSAKSFWDHKQESIGYGTKANFKGEVIDEAEATRRLEVNIAKFRAGVIARKNKYGYDWNDRQVDALTSFAYNLGPGSIDTLTANGTRDNATIANKMLQYNKASGKVLPGLARRRQQEVAMFNSGGTDGNVPPAALSPETSTDQLVQRETASERNRTSTTTTSQAASSGSSRSGTSGSTGQSRAQLSDLPQHSTQQELDTTEPVENKTPVTSNDLFGEPESPAAPQYPYNTATYSRSGHLIEMDDTPGAERLHTYHRSGSFEEYHPNGDIVERTIGSNFDIVHGDKNIHVKGNLNIVVDGYWQVVVGGTALIGAGSTIDTKSGGNTTIKAPKIDLNP